MEGVVIERSRTPDPALLKELWLGVHRRHVESMPELAPYVDDDVSYRAFAHTHPGLYATLHTTPGQGEDAELSAAFDALVPGLAAVLTGLGLPERDAVPPIRTLRSALHGFVSLEASGGFGLPADVDESFETLIDVLVTGLLARQH